ncbi:MAG: 4Fe-4S dicluster domain-containing protein [Coriobacteriaceae bacterium]|jgi:Fe-S-cluster-containing dehydrogenase component|nr:4Fe-4S dicluster domain-containing protein [Coriobacteriaceae bacterium]
MRENQGITRRVLVGGTLAAGALALTAGHAATWPQVAQAQDGMAQGTGQTNNPEADTQYGFLVNVQRCINCGKCVEACRLWSRTPQSAPARRKVEPYITGVGRELFLSLSCMHCRKPSCREVCPAGAIKKGEGGIVTVDKDRCIGCKYCYQACPFEVPHYNAVSMDKCDYCLGAGVPLGDPPRCVRACKVGALRYGKVEELLARSSRAMKIGGATDPSYVLV